MADNQANRGQQGGRATGAVDATETSAAVGGGALGAVVGSALGPVGTVAGAAAGGAMADEAVENAQAGAARQRGQGAQGMGTQGQER
jgi:uncharacterized membrane protein YebE (DUF533 family)